MKSVKEREQQRIADRNLRQEESKHTHLRRRLNGMAGGRVRGGTNRGNGKNKSTIASSKKNWSATGGHQSGE